MPDERFASITVSRPLAEEISEYAASTGLTRPKLIQKAWELYKPTLED